MKKLTLAVFFTAAVIFGVNAGRPQKIVNGQKVTYNEFPYLVSLKYKDGDSFHHFCGGAIISEWHILTAAHCVKKVPLSGIRVVVGAIDRNHVGKNYLLSKKSVPRKYRGFPKDTYFRYDIAILTLKKPLVQNNISTWKPIKLANTNYPVGTKVVVAGWGSTNFNSTKPTDDLFHIHTHLAGHSICERVTSLLKRHHLCTLPVNGMDTCQGDSGGPLVANGKIIGIVSHGIECGTYPTVYTNVRRHKNFISRIIRLKRRR